MTTLQILLIGIFVCLLLKKMVSNIIIPDNVVDPFKQIKQARKRMKFMIILTQKIVVSCNFGPQTTQFIFTILQNYE